MANQAVGLGRLGTPGTPEEHEGSGKQHSSQRRRVASGWKPGDGLAGEGIATGPHQQLVAVVGRHRSPQR